MQIRNIQETEYFTAADGCKVAEIFGIPTTKTPEGSVAYCIVPPKVKLYVHKHTFREWYIITKGKGLMYMNDETQEVHAGDNIEIPDGIWHSIENLSPQETLELYCFCTPAYHLEGTVMQDGSIPKESIERDFGSIAISRDS